MDGKGAETGDARAWSKKTNKPRKIQVTIVSNENACQDGVRRRPAAASSNSGPAPQRFSVYLTPRSQLTVQAVAKVCKAQDGAGSA